MLLIMLPVAAGMVLDLVVNRRRISRKRQRKGMMILNYFHRAELIENGFGVPRTVL